MDIPRFPDGIRNLGGLKACTKLDASIKLFDTSAMLVFVVSSGVVEQAMGEQKNKVLKIIQTLDFSRLRLRTVMRLMSLTFLPMEHAYYGFMHLIFFPHNDNGALACLMYDARQADEEAEEEEQDDEMTADEFMRANGLHSHCPCCAMCGNITNGRLKCGVCRTLYCGVACQRGHWEQHKAVCLPH